MKPELQDVLPETPPEDHPELAALLYASTEYRQLEEPFALAPNPLNGPELTLPYNHQAVVGRYFSPVTGRNRGLIMAEPGMGKTLTLILLTEQTATPNKRALIMVQNQPMVANFIANVARFTGNKYKSKLQMAEDEPVVETEDNLGAAAAREHKLTKLRDNYEFRTFTAFSDLILKKFDAKRHVLADDFIEEYKGRRIVCDESHHISATRQTKNESKLHITDTALERICGKGNIGWLKGVRETYRAFFLFFHTVPDCQVFFSTATPMIDRKTEFCFQMNLLLPQERLFLAPNSAFSVFDSLEGDDLLKEVYTHCRGMISYARSQYRARREDVGVPIGPQEVEGEIVEFVTKYVPCPMSREQYEVVDSIDRDIRSKQTDADSHEVDADDTNSFMYRSRAGSSMVYPYQKSYLVGNDRLPQPRTFRYTEGGKLRTKTIHTVFDYYFENTEDRRSWQLRKIEDFDAESAKHKQEVERFAAMLADSKSTKGLALLSSKYAYIVNEVLKDVYQDRKVTYVYTPLVRGSGLVPLLVSLILNGYQEYMPRGESNNPKYIRELVRGLLAENEKAIRAGKHPQRRVTVITSSMTKTQIDEVKAVMNAPENATGSLIHVLLGSPASGESISLSHVRRVIVASPAWNDSIMRQAIGRAFRIDSHSIRDFPGDVVVQVILLAATIPPSVEVEAAKKKRQLLAPPDVYILRLAEFKGRRNGKVYRAAKQSCFDGLINKRLNQRPGEINATAENDYMLGAYPIVSGDVSLGKDGTFTPIEPKIPRNKTYALYYDRTRVEVRDRILRYYRTKTTATLEQLIQELGYDHDTTLYALDSIIQERLQIQSAWGVQQYLMESNNVYFLQTAYTDPDPFMEHYSRCLYVEGTKENEFYVHVGAKDLIEFTISHANKHPEQISDLFTNLFDIIREKIAIMYEAYVDNSLNPPPNEEVLEHMLWRFETSIGILSGADGSEKTFHKLYYVGEQRMAGDSSYAKGVPLRPAESLGKPSRIRVFDIKEGRWRFATLEEDTEIVTKINTDIEDKKEAMNVHKMYGNRFKLDGSLHLFFPGQQKKVTTKKSAKGKKVSASKKTSTTKKTSTPKKTSTSRSKKGKEHELEEEELVALAAGEQDPEAVDDEEEQAGELDKRYKGTIGKDAATEHKTILVKVLWELSLLTPDEPKYYDEGFKMSNMPQDEESRRSLIEELKHEGRGRAAENKVSEKKLGTSLNSLDTNMLFFIWYFFLGNSKLTVPAIQPLLVARLERLGLLIDR